MDGCSRTVAVLPDGRTGGTHHGRHVWPDVGHAANLGRVAQGEVLPTFRGAGRPAAGTFAVIGGELPDVGHAAHLGRVAQGETLPTLRGDGRHVRRPATTGTSGDRRQPARDRDRRREVARRCRPSRVQGERQAAQERGAPRDGQRAGRNAGTRHRARAARPARCRARTGRTAARRTSGQATASRTARSAQAAMQRQSGDTGRTWTARGERLRPSQRLAGDRENAHFEKPCQAENEDFFNFSMTLDFIGRSECHCKSFL